ncbi:MAG: 2-oxo acid dehydrogenase subunit E2 [Acidipila sp.]|nr:2-oxo acid dehydrogenase subunit E2 [Acidipila sp.]
MAVDVIMPQMGESIFEGTITKWLKKPGDRIERDEPLFEISTDKVDAEIPAPSAGTLKEIKVAEGQTVPIQTVVAVIEAEGGAAAPSKSAAAPAPVAASAPANTSATAAAPSSGGAAKTEAAGAKSSTAPATPPKPEPASPAEPRGAAATAAPGDTALSTKPAPGAAAQSAGKQASAPAPAAAPAGANAARDSGDGRKIRSSPLVRRLARESNVDLAGVPGTGAGGRVSKHDILGAIESGGSSAAAPAARPSPAMPATGGTPAGGTLETAVPREKMYFGHYEVQPMSNMRQKIAQHMVASKRVSPHVYSIDEADMTKIAKLRGQVKDEFEKRYGVKLSFMPFFVRATIEALRAFPALNTSVDGTSVVMHREFNIGIAVALDSGLIVPVIKNAEEKNFLGIQRAVTDLADRARTKKLKPEEVTESTFSITNPGTFGGLMGLPVINQPNVGILGLGAIQKRAVVVDDAIAIRSMVYLTLSYDHRSVDGAIAHQFLHKVKTVLEEWNENIL